MKVENINRSGNGSEEKSFAQKVIIAVSISAFGIVLLLILKSVFSVVLLILAGTLIAVYFRGFGSLLSEKTGMSSTLALWIVILSTIAGLLLVSWLLGARIQQQIDELEKSLPEYVSLGKEKLRDSEWGKQLLEGSGNLEKQVMSGDLAGSIGGFFKTTFGVFGDIYIILFIGIFFTAQPWLYKNSILALVPADSKGRGDQVLSRLGVTLRDWLAGKMFAMVVVAILTAVGLSVLGMPMVLALAVIAGILNFVPNFGPLVAMIPAVLIGLSRDTTTALLVAGLYILVQVLESNVITPLVQRRLISIPPAFIIIGQVTMGLLTGALGIVLATPVIAIIMVLIQELYVKRIAGDSNELGSEKTT